MSIDVTFTCTACPVQAEGIIDGHPIYFRARWQSWSLVVGRVGDSGWISSPEWECEAEYGAGLCDAGYMPLDEARTFIEEAVERWRNWVKQQS